MLSMINTHKITENHDGIIFLNEIKSDIID